MALKEFHTDIDLKGYLMVNGSAGTSEQVLVSGGPSGPMTWQTRSVITSIGSGLQLSSGVLSVTAVVGIDPVISAMLF